MMATMLVNQEVSPLGLNALRMTILTGSSAFASERERKLRDPVVDDVLNIGRADARLLHRGRVDVDLELCVASGPQVVLETRGNVHDEHEPAPVHGRVDLAGGDQLGSLEAGRIEGMDQLLESAEWSSSTKAIDAWFTSVEVPLACV